MLKADVERRQPLVCADCGLPKSQWTENSGQGIRDEYGQQYCSKVCAEVALVVLGSRGGSPIN